LAAALAESFRAVNEAKGTWLALVATGMDSFEAIGHASQGNRTVAAHLWLQALRLVEIPAGTFKIGSPKTEINREDDEGPQRQVTIDHPFRMSAVPFPQGGWEAAMGNNPSRFQGDLALPVEQVSWDDLTGPKGFLVKLNAVTEGARPEGMVFRLPSETEWEYACRAGTATAYSFGDDLVGLADHGWTNDNADGRTHPVGQKRPNAWGLHDLHGNVWEWCGDVWHDGHRGAPRDGSTWLTGGDQARRVLRGGSWCISAGKARSAYRGMNDTTDRNGSVGFRVVLAAVVSPTVGLQGAPACPDRTP
jgi:formylglycine-generating enzyme required for sulfatase activity